MYEKKKKQVSYIIVQKYPGSIMLGRMSKMLLV